jgi:hypothetical protein
MPYVLGNTLGYGEPSLGSSGTFRGAYSVANQVLASMTLDSVRWKFQYDFTGPQAIGTIKNIGLTHQYTNPGKLTPDKFEPLALLSDSYVYTCDGRYSFVCSTIGIITKYDNLAGTTSTIDVSAIVGTDSGEKKIIGYAPATELYYVYLYSATAENRMMYVFSDATFANNTVSYSMSNCTYSPTHYTMYIYENKAFFLGNNILNKADFVNNLSETTQSAPAAHPYLGSISFTPYFTKAFEKYIIKIGTNNNLTGWIYDMESEQFVSYLTRAINTVNYEYRAAIRHPVTNNFMPVLAHSALYNNCAIAAKVLDDPVVKTDANGLTATYELEVFWDL